MLDDTYNVFGNLDDTWLNNNQTDHVHHIVKRTESCTVNHDKCARQREKVYEICYGYQICQMFFTLLVFIAISILGNIGVIVHLFTRPAAFDIRTLIQFMCLLNAVHMLFLPWHLVANFLYKSIPFAEVTRDATEYNKALYNAVKYAVEILSQWSVVLLCKDRFFRWWTPEKSASGVSNRRKATTALLSLLLITLIYIVPMFNLITYRDLIFYCDDCRGTMRIFSVIVDKSTRKNWLSKFLYMTVAPVMLTVFIPDIIIFLLNVVLHDDNDDEAMDDDSKKTTRFITWAANLHLLFDIPQPIRYMFFYDAGRITARTEGQIYSVLVLCTAMKSCAIVFLYIGMEIHERFIKNKKKA